MDSHEELKNLIERCRLGHEDAFEQLVELYSARCYGYFYRLTGNADASEELLSQLFIKLVRKIRLYDGGSFENWLFKIASNIFNDYLRREYRQKKLLKTRAEQLDIEQAKSSSGADSYMTEKLQRSLLRLDSETAELLMQRFYNDMSFRELAQMRGEPIGTTLSRVHRAIRKLKELMECTDD